MQGWQGQSSRHAVQWLTILVCGNCDSCELLGRETQLRDAIRGLNFKGVVHMWHKVQHRHGGVDETRVPGDEADSPPTYLTLAGIWPTFLTDDTVSEIFSSSSITWWAPFQHESCFINVKNHIPGSRRWPCKDDKERLLSDNCPFWWGQGGGGGEWRNTKNYINFKAIIYKQTLQYWCLNDEFKGKFRNCLDN